MYRSLEHAQRPPVCTDDAHQESINALAEEFLRRSMVLFSLLSPNASLRDIEDYFDALDAREHTENIPRPRYCP